MTKSAARYTIYLYTAHRHGGERWFFFVKSPRTAGKRCDISTWACECAWRAGASHTKRERRQRWEWERHTLIIRRQLFVDFARFAQRGAFSLSSGRRAAGIFVWMSQIEFALHHKLLFGFGSERGKRRNGCASVCTLSFTHTHIQTPSEKRMEFLTSAMPAAVAATRTPVRHLYNNVRWLSLPRGREHKVRQSRHVP